MQVGVGEATVGGGGQAGRCQHCASDNPPGSAFCQSCGQRLEIICTSCRRGCSAAAKFCAWCGGSLVPDARVAEPGGERKQATVLFADIVGSTEMIAGLDAEEAMDRLQPVVAAMSRAVRRFDGAILRTLGDGLKAAFGAPLAREGHALLACQAALAMRDAVAGLAFAPSIRIGLHSGEVVAGALNTGTAVELEAQGMTVHLASRIEQAATPGAIYISGACRDLVGAYCETEELGSHVLRGFNTPVELHRLIGLRPAIASDQFRGGDLARFLGRETELAALKDALRRAETGIPSVIGICASAGLGKSRLCFEFSEWCRRRRIEVFEGRAHVFGKATPLLPVIEMLRTFLRVSAGTEPATARERITQRLGAMGLDIGEDLPILLEFLSIPAPDLVQPHLEPGGRLMRLRHLVRSMTKAAGQWPSVIIVEDLHWLDDASAAFMETLVEAAEGTHTVIVLNFRPTWSPPFLECSYYKELRLYELPTIDAWQMVRDLLGVAPELRTMVTHVATQSGGNPFFVEQLVLSLVQGGVLTGARGDYRLTDAAPSDIALPATLEAVIGARLDALDERVKTILQIGAIIGKEFPQVLVERVAGIDAVQARILLAQLCDAELIQTHALVGEPGFAFRHPLIQEVAYGTQLRTRRTRLHAAVAGAIESQDWGRRDEFAGLLAYHCESAGQPVEAATHLQRAAVWIGRTDPGQAIQNWKRIRLLLRDHPRSSRTERLSALASGQILSFGWRGGLSAEEAGPYAEEALRYARNTTDSELYEPLLLSSYGRILSASGASDDYLRMVQEALLVAGTNGDPVRRGTMNIMASQAYWQSGRLQEALAANDEALAAFADRQDGTGGPADGMSVNQVFGFDVEHWVKCLRTRILVWLGRFDEAETWIERVSRVDPATIDYVVQFIPHFAGVEMAWHKGDRRAAKEHARVVTDYADRSELPYLRVRALACQGLAASAGSDFVAAAHHFNAALEGARQAKAGLELEARLLANIADTHHKSGNESAARSIAIEAIGVARRRTDRLAECHASVVALISGEIGEMNLLARTKALLAETGATVLVAALPAEWRDRILF